MIEAIAIIGGLGTTGLAVAIVVMAFKLVRAKDDVIAAGDQIDKWRDESNLVRGQLALEEAAHGVTQAQLKTEQDLRSVAEARLNLAQRRVTELLKSHLERATDEEIRAATAAAFADFDGGVPLSETDPYKADGLLDPGLDVPDA